MDSPWMFLDPGPYCAFPFRSWEHRFCHHAAELRDHVEALLLAQVLGAHDRLLVEQVAGPGLLLEVTLDHVDGPVHVLAGDLAGLLVLDHHRQFLHLLPSVGWAAFGTFAPPPPPCR